MNFLYKICQSSKREHNNSKSSSLPPEKEAGALFSWIAQTNKTRLGRIHRENPLIPPQARVDIHHNFSYYYYYYSVCILCESKGWYPLWLCILFAVCAAFNHPMFDNPQALSLWHGIPCRSTCWGMDLHNTRIKRFSLIQKVQTDLWSDCMNSFHLYLMSLDSLQMITSDAE